MRLLPLLAAVLLVAPPLPGAVTLFPTSQIDVLWADNFQFTRPLTDHRGHTLSGGTPFQVGYFSGLPSSSNPAGFGLAQWETFTALTGEGSLNPSLDTRISGASPGFFTIAIQFFLPEHNGIPVFSDPSVLVAIRLFDQSTVADSTHFNIVTSQDWILQPADIPPDNPLPTTASLDLGVMRNNLVWQSGPTGAFSTSLPLPEPSTPLLIALAGCLALLFRRRL